MGIFKYLSSDVSVRDGMELEVRLTFSERDKMTRRLRSLKRSRALSISVTVEMLEEHYIFISFVYLDSWRLNARRRRRMDI